MNEFYPLPRKLRIVFLYNFISFLLWICCIVRLMIFSSMIGVKFVSKTMSDFFHTLSITQFFGFFLVKQLKNKKINRTNIICSMNSIKMVWICCITMNYPDIQTHLSYFFLLLSWNIENTINFFYHSFKIKTNSSPFFLFWLQYHNFYVLFWFDIISEMFLMFLSLEFVQNDTCKNFIKCILISYVPLGYLAWDYLKKRKLMKYSRKINRKSVSKIKT